MRIALAAIVACSLGCEAVPPPATPNPVAQGALASIEASNDLDGGVIGSADARATVVVVFASWCEHCHHELEVLAGLRAAHPAMRVLGINYRGHEEYDHRGNSVAVRGYLAEHAPWLRVVPADERLFGALGSPPRIPTLLIYDRAGNLVTTFDRRGRNEPEARELEAVLHTLGA